MEQSKGFRLPVKKRKSIDFIKHYMALSKLVYLSVNYDSININPRI